MPKTKTIEVNDLIVTYEDTPALRKKVFEKVLAFFVDMHAFHPESVMQNDNPIIEAPSVMANICEAFDFKVEEK